MTEPINLANTLDRKSGYEESIPSPSLLVSIFTGILNGISANKKIHRESISNENIEAVVASAQCIQKNSNEATKK